METVPAIVEFWRWWPSVRGRLEAAIEQRGWTDALMDEISARVHALAPALAWSVGPGRTARHAFCISAAADPALRVLCERWRRAAPADAADATWEFHGARQPQPGIAVMLGDLLLDPGGVRVAFTIDPARERIDLSLHHPALAELEDEMRHAAAMVTLESALGEDDVDRWIGWVEVAAAEPAGALGLPDLAQAVAALAHTATREQFALLEGEDEGGQKMFVAVNQAIKRADHLLCDHHVEVELEADDAREDALIAALGDAAVFVAHETCGPTRWLHFYAPAEARAAFERAGVRATFASDPLWQTLSCFTDALRQ
jgi:hypothetical protein